MSNVMDMLVKAGYEASSIGSDVLPSTLRMGDEPIGFLLEDLSVQLLPNHEAERRRLESVISFAKENQGLDEVQGEYKLSQYQDVILTATYDFDSGRPIYNIYHEDKDKNLILRNSSEDRAIAAQDFVSRSGLVSGQIPTPTRETDRIGKFIEAIQAKGFQLRENKEEAHRAFDIADKDGKTVGYIGKNNRVTITSENSGIKRTLSNAYIDTNPDQLILPSFFEKLKERLKEIGLALKVIFTGKGQHYAIRNEKQQEIATVSEMHQITYTDLATNAERAKIDALVEEIRREDQERQNPQREESQVLPEKQDERNRSEAVKEAPAFTPEEMRDLADAVLADPTMTYSLFGVILSNPDFLSRLNTDLAEKLQLLRSDTKPDKDVIPEFTINGFEADDIGFYANISYAGKEYRQIVCQQGEQFYVTTGTHERIRHNFTPQQTNQYLAFEKSHLHQVPRENLQLTAAETKISQDFDRYIGLLQTYSGFNPEECANIKTAMIARFGTADPKEFQDFLQQGKFSKGDTLEEKLKTSQRIAELQNAKSKPEPVKEQQKERA